MPVELAEFGSLQPLPCLALPHAAFGEVFGIRTPANWTHHVAIRPALGHKKGYAIVWIAEVNDGFLECFRCFHVLDYEGEKPQVNGSV